MTIKPSGVLALHADIVGEFGGVAPHSLSEYYRGGSYVISSNTNVPASGPLAFSTFYSAARRFELVISTSIQQANLATLLNAAGWDGVTPVQVTVESNAWLWSDSVTEGGLIISGIPDGSIIDNYGKIIGRGGDGGGARIVGASGGPAVVNTSSGITLRNYAGAYIAGGGGGGAGGWQGGGGGGAGGGTGGYATDEYDLAYRVLGGAGGAIGLAGADGGMGDNLEESHANADQFGVGGNAGGAGGGVNIDGGTDRDPVGGGGGGGRILPGVGVNASIPSGTRSDYPGGYGGGGGQTGGEAGYPYYASPATQYVDADGGTFFHQAGGGGGGWGAAGGASYAGSGGQGGKAITGAAGITLVNTGTIYGETV